MTETLSSLSHRISGAADLESVVRSMKALAASSIGQYEKSVLALSDYYRSIELGLMVCLRQTRPSHEKDQESWRFNNRTARRTNLIVFGSDQGLVGQFNEQIAELTFHVYQGLEGQKNVWTVGERIHFLLLDGGIQPVKLFVVPTSVNAITHLVGKLLLEMESEEGAAETNRMHLVYQRPISGGVHQPYSQPLLPLDQPTWHRLAQASWPTKTLPETLDDSSETLRALVGEYLFVSLFKACAESLVCENASRLASMQRAEKNINERLVDLNQSFRQLRQASIDEELFEVLSGYEALSEKRRNEPRDVSK